jgi:hypothetical protein
MTTRGDSGRRTNSNSKLTPIAARIPADSRARWRPTHSKPRRPLKAPLLAEQVPDQIATRGDPRPILHRLSAQREIPRNVILVWLA